MFFLQCWDFSTVGLIEQQYRKNGIEKGFLKPEEYVKFSEQAYGISVAKECLKDPSKCDFNGDEIYKGDTEGGEIAQLYYFRNALEKQILPHEVCPYVSTEDPKTDLKCPGMDDALKKNPIDMTVKSFKTIYDLDSLKQELVEKNNSLGFTTPVARNYVFYPQGDEADAIIKKYNLSCLNDKVPCPLDGHYPTQMCWRCADGYTDFDGDFKEEADISLAGGHGMNIVGYNDDFMTTEGHQGILIIRNNWSDGNNRGSHTVDYFAQRISHQDDEYVCPNAHFPQNWYKCADKDACFSPDAEETATAMTQPLSLACSAEGIKTGACSADTDVVYYTSTQRLELDDLNVYCFHEYNTKTKVFIANNLCLEPLAEGTIGTLFNPTKKDLINDADRCGFYIMSYHTYLEWQGRFHDMFVNSVDLEFSDASYAAHQDSSKSYDLVKKSTSKQNVYKFNGPFPQYDSELPKAKKSFRV
eukprot:TRINITY_DN38_c0_g1_i1.p1 TRINITY_DN38_c0_g1~~TRINITY_DN38_c0_g1_i1.p1  ORF type:complete len:471 (-),score=129.10 TRINITY_DN38_c0_g1_i1:431-1843(-)